MVSSLTIKIQVLLTTYLWEQICGFTYLKNHRELEKYKTLYQQPGLNCLLTCKITMKYIWLQTHWQMHFKCKRFGNAEILAGQKCEERVTGVLENMESFRIYMFIKTVKEHMVNIEVRTIKANALDCT